MDGSHLLLVPVRVSREGSRILMVGRLPDGTATGIAFSSRTAMATAMATSTPQDRDVLQIAPGPYRAMLAEIGVTRVQVDPILVAPRIEPAAQEGAPPAPGNVAPGNVLEGARGVPA